MDGIHGGPAFTPAFLFFKLHDRIFFLYNSPVFQYNGKNTAGDRIRGSTELQKNE